jgi:glycosyltransferase involved in cell wall biosynthesis
MFTLNSRFLTQSLTGVQRYGYELFKQINLQKNLNVEYLIPDTPVIKDYKIDTPDKLKKTGKYKGHLWEQIDLPHYLKKRSNPLLLNLCNTAPLFYSNKVVTVHDISFVRGNWHSKRFKMFYKSIIPLILKNSKHVITVSEFSKREIMDVYHIEDKKISVIYNAPFASAVSYTVNNSIKKKPYILSVGSIDARKNLKRLIKAFLTLNNDDITLCLIGQYNSNFKIDPELDQLINNNKKNVFFLGYVTDEELLELYQNALMFVYPSLYEGFGLPPIEAMANNCPVITSNVSSLPEVCGKGALYFDPLNINDIAEKIKAMIANTKLRENYIFEGKLNAEKYSWQISGQKLISEMKNL